MVIKVRPKFAGEAGYALGFCPTGPGGGVDSSCGKGGDGKAAERSAKGTSATANRASDKANKTGKANDHAHASWKHLVAAKKHENMGNAPLAKAHYAKAAEHSKKAMQA